MLSYEKSFVNTRFRLENVEKNVILSHFAMAFLTFAKVDIATKR